jgi:hypothetical protein
MNTNTQRMATSPVPPALITDFWSAAYGSGRAL